MRPTLIFPALAPLICVGSLTAATVSFDPPEVFIDPSVDSFVVDFDVSVVSDDGSPITGVELIIGSEDLTLSKFAYDPSFLEVAAFTTPPGPIGIYPSDLFIGAFLLAPQQSPLLIGVLTVDVPAYPPGTYSIFVGDDCFDCKFPTGFQGEAFVHVVPEPGVFVLLFFGGVGLFAIRMRGPGVCAFLTLTFLASPADAGTVSFDPPEVFIDPVIDSTQMEFEVWASADGNASVQGIEIVIGSHDLSLVGFEQNLTYPICSVDGCFSFAPVGIYHADWYVGFLSTGTAASPHMGTLKVEAGGLPPGSYDILVDSLIDGGYSNINAGEPVFGRATVHVIPEPATLAFFLLGAALLVGARRRFWQATALILALGVASPAWAGTVSFDPPEVFIDPAVDLTIVEFGLTVSSNAGGSVQGFDAVVGSYKLALVGFDHAIICPNCFTPVPPDPFGSYPSDLFVGAFITPQLPSPVFVGTLTVEASGLPPGSYDLIVDSDLDGGISNVNGEALYGRATVHVIPEPVTLSFLVIGSLILGVGRRSCLRV